jgi:NDP-sugar pyrophosphorylase family protein
VPVNGEALARRVIRWLVSRGAVDVVVNLHHHPQTITREIGDGGDLGARVRYSWEDPVLGSAGGPRHALPLLGPTFLLVNGDTLTDVDVTAMFAAHRSAAALVTMALIRNPRPDKYGGVALSEDGWVTGFTRAGAVAESFHFVGVQIAEAEAFASLEDGVPAETVNRLYPRLIAGRRQAVLGFVSDASFRDIGTPRDYLDTSAELARVEGDRLSAGVRGTRSPSARLVRTAVWDDVVIGPDVELVDCVVCDGARLPGGARFERCAIVPATPVEGVTLVPDATAGDRIEGGLLIRPIR